MNNLVIKIATWAFLIGLVLTGYGLWEVFKERNVNSEAIVMHSNSIADPKESLVYTSITGGKVDITNMYELSLSTRKTNAKLTTEYYAPVINGDDTLAYILKSSLAPTLQDMAKVAEYKGLLQSKSELPSKILDAYSQSFPNTNFVYLDSTYKPETILEKLLGLKMFIYLLVGGLVVRTLLGFKKKVVSEEVSSQ